MTITKRVMAIDEEQINLSMQREILQTVVQDNRIDPEAPKGKTPALHAVTINNHNDAGVAKIPRHHIRLIPGLFRSTEHGMSVRNNQGVWAVTLGQPTPKTADR